MAYIRRPRPGSVMEDDDQRRNPAPGSGGGMMIPAPAPQTPQAPQVAPTVQAAKPVADTGRRFPLMSQYLTANKGMGQGMAGAVAGQVNTAADRASGAINTAVNDFKKGVEKGTGGLLPPGGGVVSKNIVGGKPSIQKPIAGVPMSDNGLNDSPATALPGYTPGGYVQQSGLGGSGWVPTDDWFATLNKPIGYSGPNSFAETEGFTAAGKALGGAQEKAAAAGSFGGVQELLRDAYGGPYSSGLSRLDAGLVSQADRSGIDAARSRYPELSKALGNAVKDSAGIVQAARDKAASRDAERQAELAKATTLKTDYQAMQDKAAQDAKDFAAGEREREATQRAAWERQQADDRARRDAVILSRGPFGQKSPEDMLRLQELLRGGR